MTKPSAISPNADTTSAIRASLQAAMHLSGYEEVQLAKVPNLFSGKYLRSHVAYCAYDSFQNHRETEILTIATVIELIHLATLLHDDVLDHHQMRRSAPTLFAVLGDKASVLAGDFTITNALILISELQNASYNSIVSIALKNIFSGELEQHLTRSMVPVMRYVDRIERKTGALFGAAAELGTLAGSRDPAIGRRAHDIGNLIGAAYQMADDYWDYFANETDTGKSLGHDLKNGIVTLPSVLLESVQPGGWKEARAQVAAARKPEDVVTLLRHQMIAADVPGKISDMIRSNLNAADLLAREITTANSPLASLVAAYRAQVANLGSPETVA
jgi:geranylgeranyl pyrophosphate synthase